MPVLKPVVQAYCASDDRYLLCLILDVRYWDGTLPRTAQA